MFDAYTIIFAGGILVSLSYLFNIISRKFQIPSVLLLIGTGVVIKQIANYYEYRLGNEFFTVLEFLGIIGLIMIVLEAAVDLNLSRKKLPLIKQSFLLSLVILILSSLGIAVLIMIMRNEPFFSSLIYAIPLSVVSSAVMIPSVHTLTRNKQEFLIYESTFSDIIGIMFFNFIVLQGGKILSLSGLWMIVATVFFSILLSYVMVYFFSKIKTHIKFFLIMAILALLYAVGKKLHLSSLLIIFIFGLVLNNAKFFFRGKLSNFLNFKTISLISKDFKIITAETAFVVRTFFFVAFGMSIDLGELIDTRVWTVGTMIVILLYLIRYLNFKMFLKTDVYPEIFLAPRGLITVLLFFSIPAQFQINDFSVGILSFVILATGIIMMIALIAFPNINYDKTTIVDIGSSPADIALIEDTDPSGPYCEIDNGENGNENKKENEEKNE